MSDEKPPDQRWLVERIDRNHAEDRADIADLKRAIAEIPNVLDRYLLQQVYDADERRRKAERDADNQRLGALEDHNKSTSTNGRTWMVGVALAAIGAVFGYIAQLLQAKGGH